MKLLALIICISIIGCSDNGTYKQPCEKYGRYDYSVPKYKRGIVCKE